MLELQDRMRKQQVEEAIEVVEQPQQSPPPVEQSSPPVEQPVEQPPPPVEQPVEQPPVVEHSPTPPSSPPMILSELRSQSFLEEHSTPTNTQMSKEAVPFVPPATYSKTYSSPSIMYSYYPLMAPPGVPMNIQPMLYPFPVQQPPFEQNSMDSSSYTNAYVQGYYDALHSISSSSSSSSSSSTPFVTLSPFVLSAPSPMVMSPLSYSSPSRTTPPSKQSVSSTPKSSPLNMY